MALYLTRMTILIHYSSLQIEFLLSFIANKNMNPLVNTSKYIDLLSYNLCPLWKGIIHDIIYVIDDLIIHPLENPWFSPIIMPNGLTYLIDFGVRCINIHISQGEDPYTDNIIICKKYIKYCHVKSFKDWENENFDFSKLRINDNSINVQEIEKCVAIDEKTFTLCTPLSRL